MFSRGDFIIINSENTNLQKIMVQTDRNMFRTSPEVFINSALTPFQNLFDMFLNKVWCPNSKFKNQASCISYFIVMVYHDQKWLTEESFFWCWFSQEKFITTGEAWQWVLEKEGHRSIDPLFNLRNETVWIERPPSVIYFFQQNSIS